MHAREGAPVILRPIQGHPWVRLAAGSTLVLTPWLETSPSARAGQPKSAGVLHG